jgi:hypothetical protein
MIKIAHYRVVFEQVRERPGIRQVIHGHKIDVVVAETRTHDISPDAAKPVYPHFNCHLVKIPP